MKRILFLAICLTNGIILFSQNIDGETQITGICKVKNPGRFSHQFRQNNIQKGELALWAFESYSKQVVEESMEIRSVDENKFGKIDSTLLNLKRIEITDTSFKSALDMIIIRAERCQFKKDKLPAYIYVEPVFEADTSFFRISIWVDDYLIERPDHFNNYIKGGLMYKGYNVIIHKAINNDNNDRSLCEEMFNDRFILLNEHIQFYSHQFYKNNTKEIIPDYLITGFRLIDNQYKLFTVELSDNDIGKPYLNR